MADLGGVVNNYLTNPDSRPGDARLIFDLNCNAGCAHCCETAGPHRTEKMEWDVFEAAAKKLSAYKIPTIAFSGGEPTMDFERLLKAVKYLRKDAGYKGEVWVQTNAHWAKNDEEARDVLLRLKDAGVDCLDIPSLDKHHEEKFKAGEYAPRAARIAGELGFGDLSVLYKTPKLMQVAEELGYGGGERAGPEKVIPIGRARILPESEWDLDKSCEAGFGTITIDTKGNVYPCCWHRSRPMGKKITEDSLENILKAGRKDALLVKLAEKGVRGVPAEMLGMTGEEKEKSVKKFGECRTCDDYFSEHPKP